MQNTVPKDAHVNELQQALAAINGGRLTEALSLCTAVLDRDGQCFDAWHLQGLALLRLGRLQNARTALETAHGLGPDNAEVLIKLGVVHERLGETGAAEHYYRQALGAPSTAPTAHHRLGALQLNRGQGGEAETWIRRAMEQGATGAPVYTDLATALFLQHRLSEAGAAIRQALVHDPRFAPAVHLQAVLLHEQGDLDRAGELYRAALILNPQLILGYNNLGLLYREQGRLAEAADAFRRALALKGDFHEAANNLALAELTLGDYANGWDHHRFRPQVRELGLSPAGERLPANLAGQTIALLGEQGLGDELFFLRFVPELTRRGAQVIYVTASALGPLVRTSGLCTVVDRPDDLPPGLSRHALGDLPFLLCLEREHAMPPSISLQADTGLRRQAREALAKLGPPPYTGLTWRAGPVGQTRRLGHLAKAVAPDPLGQALAEAPGTLVSLQRQPRAGETEQLARRLGRPLHDLSEWNQDLAAITALLAELDDYVAVSNTNVHLRAALGKATRVLVPYPPEWRWGAGEDRSPWFPHCPVYRQTADGDWAAALSRLRDDLGGP